MGSIKRSVQRGVQLVTKRKKDIETPNFWNAEYRKCKDAHARHRAHCLRYANMMDDDLWRGTLLPDMTEPQQVNELKSTVFTILPYILLEPPEINIRSHSMQDTSAAMVWEQVVKYAESQYYLFEELIRAAYDALLYGDGIFKFGYWDDPLLDRPTFASGLSVPYNAERVAHATHTPLYEVYPDRRARRWNEQSHMFHVVPKHMEDLLDNKVYNQKVVRQLGPSLSDTELYGYSKLTEDTGEAEFVQVAEVHDFKRQMLRLFAVEQPNAGWIFEGPLPYGIPIFEHLYFFQRPLSVWNDGLGQTLEKHQKQLSNTLTYMDRAISRDGIIKILYDLAVLGEVEMNKMKSNRDELIGVNNPRGDLGTAIHVVDYATSVKDYNYQTAMAVLDRIMRKASGVSMQEQGAHEPGVETKYEASMLKGASQVRNLMRRRMFSTFAERSLYKLLYIISLEYTPQRICEMAGLDPYLHAPLVAKFLPFDSRKFKIEFGNSAVNSRTERIQKLQTFMQLLGPYQQMINPASWVQLVTETLDFDYKVEMLVYNSLGMGAQQQGQIANVPSVMNAAQGVQQSRTTNTPQQPMDMGSLL